MKHKNRTANGILTYRPYFLPSLCLCIIASIATAFTLLFSFHLLTYNLNNASLLDLPPRLFWDCVFYLFIFFIAVNALCFKTTVSSEGITVEGFLFRHSVKWDDITNVSYTEKRFNGKVCSVFKSKNGNKKTIGYFLELIYGIRTSHSDTIFIPISDRIASNIEKHIPDKIRLCDSK